MFTEQVIKSKVSVIMESVTSQCCSVSKVFLCLTGVSWCSGSTFSSNTLHFLCAPWETLSRKLAQKVTSVLLKFKMQSELCQIECYIVQWSNAAFGKQNWKVANCLPTSITRYSIYTILFIWLIAFIYYLWIIKSLHIYIIIYYTIMCW